MIRARSQSHDPIASVPFLDGVTRPVCLDPDGRQSVLGQDGEQVSGVWMLTDEVLEDTPVLVEGA